MEEILNDINWAVIAPFLVIQFVLMVVALIDWFKKKDTNGPRWLWLIIILLINTIGPILYFIFGRNND